MFVNKMDNKNKISKDTKIKYLEKLIKTIYGRPEAKIKYSNIFYDTLEIELSDCDIEDTFKTVENLKNQNIELSFYQNVEKNDLTKIEKKYRKYAEKYYGVTNLTIIFKPDYYEEKIKIQKQIEELKNKLGEYLI